MQNHIPVLLHQAVSLLRPAAGGLYVDGTVGYGGHAEAVLRAAENVRLIVIDRDPGALKAARERLLKQNARTEFRQGSFAEVLEELAAEGVRVDGVLFDLGISSAQLSDAARGFSYESEGPLDMRFDPQERLTAKEVVNTYPYPKLRQLFTEYGEEPMAGRIAKEIVRTRGRERLSTTRDLREAVYRAVPPAYFHRGDVLPRVFQAVRIEVNDELSAVERGLETALKLLKPGGRLVVISFHSLEDRIVKTLFRKKANEGILKLLVKKPLVPDEAERRENPRSRSAKLRAAEAL